MSGREPRHDLDAAWIGQTRALLDESAASLDAATLSRLNRARQTALARRRPLQRWYLPAGLVSACVLLLALFAWQGPWRALPAHLESPLTAKAAAGSDLELVSSDDGPEFYQDLEFYAWLDAQDQDQDLGS